MRRKINGNAAAFIYAICVGLLLIMTGILFYDYLTGEKIFLFPGMVSDGINQFYPHYVKASRMFTENFGLGGFTFESGWGRTLSYTNPFEILIVLFGENNVAYMIGFVTVLRIVFAGAAFTAFLKEKGMERISCIIFGICYAFSLQVLGGGCWKTQAELAVIIAVYLLAIERLKKKKGLISLGLALLLTYLCLNTYYIITLIAFLVVYTVCDLIISGKRISVSPKKLKGFLLAGIFLFALLAVVFYPEISSIFRSYRFQAGIQSAESAWKKTFSNTNLKILVTTYLRTLDPNILGIPGVTEYYGGEFGWYIGDGGYYCGILSFLVLPQVFRKEEKKRNIVYIVEFIGCGLIIACPVIRLVANGFADQVFKLTREWITVIYILASAVAFDEIIKDKSKLDIKKLFLTWGVIVISLIILAFTKLKGRIYYYDAAGVIFFSTCIVIWFLVWYKKQGNIRHQVILTVLIAAEIISLDYQFINNQGAVTREAFLSGYYLDGTDTAIEKAVISDKEFYRIEKGYRSVFLDDASVQGYNGTTFYVGGVADQSCTDMLTQLGIPTLWNQRGYCAGTYGNVKLGELFAVRYTLTKYDQIAGFGYENISRIGDIRVFKNQYALPIAFTYNDVISRSEFENIPYLERDELILQSAVVEDDTILEQCDTTDSYNTTRIEPIWEMEIEDYQIGTGVAFETIQENQTLVVTLEDSEEKCVNLVWSSVEEAWTAGKECVISIYGDYGVGQSELTGQTGACMLVMQSINMNEVTSVDKVTLSVYDTGEYYKVYRDAVDARSADVFQMDSYTDEYIKGEIEVDEAKLLYISIPYDAAFDYYIDGQKTEKYRVNYAFSGVMLPAGYHTVEMKYSK